jgi:hypothetical protein
MDVEPAMAAIKDKIDGLEVIQDSKQFEAWKNAVLGTLSRATPYDSVIYSQISSIRAVGNYGGDATEEAKSMAKHLLMSFLADIKRFGLSTAPPSGSQAGSNPTIINYQSTYVNIDIEVVVAEDSSDVYVKFSGFEGNEDAEEYAQFLAETLPLLLFESTRLQ